MARKRMVTRTITLTRATAAVLTQNGEFKTVEFDRIPLEIASKSDDKIKDYCNEYYKLNGISNTVVHILAKTSYEKQFGMSEEDFIKLSQELDETTDD